MQLCSVPVDPVPQWLSPPVAQPPSGVGPLDINKLHSITSAFNHQRSAIAKLACVCELFFDANTSCSIQHIHSVSIQHMHPMSIQHMHPVSIQHMHPVHVSHQHVHPVSIRHMHLVCHP